MPEKHSKSGTSLWKVPLRCYKDTTFFSRKQIVLKTSKRENRKIGTINTGSYKLLSFT